MAPQQLEHWHFTGTLPDSGEASSLGDEGVSGVGGGYASFDWDEGRNGSVSGELESNGTAALHWQRQAARKSGLDLTMQYLRQLQKQQQRNSILRALGLEGLQYYY